MSNPIQVAAALALSRFATVTFGIGDGSRPGAARHRH
ncbi:hypothetical protein Thiowin_03097 [Thiorhodovibrio winogradskyi]|uniref:Uncharacterized protein n=1 Tax=Thiorhodovibrio winogradskyi TaxID=77007 RepID=A0ABZ0SD52_9GAMM